MSPDLSSPAPLAMSKPIVRTFVVPFVLLSLLSMLWALASPVFSIPDENAHATKAIAVVRGS